MGGCGVSKEEGEMEMEGRARARAGGRRKVGGKERGNVVGGREVG